MIIKKEVQYSKNLPTVNIQFGYTSLFEIFKLYYSICVYLKLILPNTQAMSISYHKYCRYRLIHKSQIDGKTLSSTKWEKLPFVSNGY
jgi:cbb3-type cytochrome oxidase subunit 1